MAEEVEVEETEETTESNDDTSWTRMESLIEKTVRKVMGEESKKWEQPRNSPRQSSPKSQTPQKTRGFLSEAFFGTKQTPED